MTKNFTVTNKSAGQRLDIYCVSCIPAYSRAVIQKAIKNGDITINNNTVKPRQIIHDGDNVSISLNSDNVAPDQSSVPTPKLSIPIIYEDKDVVIINKPPRLTVHPGIGNEAFTVASWFSNKYPASKNVGEDKDRAGIVHRLDKDTSGVLILAKNETSYDHLKKQFKKRRVKKEYQALVFGIPSADKGRITRPLARSRRNPLRRTIDSAGKPAITEWQLDKKYNGKFALLKAFPFTGRTHQIRVHLHFLGHPIIGDQLYTFKRQRPPQGVARQMLHAQSLTLSLPSGNKKTFTAPLPSDFTAVLENLTNV